MFGQKKGNIKLVDLSEYPVLFSPFPVLKPL